MKIRREGWVFQVLHSRDYIVETLVMPVKWDNKRRISCTSFVRVNHDWDLSMFTLNGHHPFFFLHAGQLMLKYRLSSRPLRDSNCAAWKMFLWCSWRTHSERHRFALLWISNNRQFLLWRVYSLNSQNRYGQTDGERVREVTGCTTLTEILISCISSLLCRHRLILVVH